MKIHSNSTLLMIGDSITDCGRVRPVAETVSDDLGNGCVSLIHAMLGATCPQRHIRIATRASPVIPFVISPPAGNPMSWT